LSQNCALVAEPVAEPQRGIAGDRALALNDLRDALAARATGAPIRSA